MSYREKIDYYSISYFIHSFITLNSYYKVKIKYHLLILLKVQSLVSKFSLADAVLASYFYFTTNSILIYFCFLVNRLEKLYIKLSTCDFERTSIRLHQTALLQLTSILFVTTIWLMQVSKA